MKLNKPPNFFAAKVYKARIPPKQTRTPRKQAKPRKIIAGLQEKKVENLDSSSDEDAENIPQEPAKEESKETKSKKNKLNRTHAAAFRDKANGQNDVHIGMDRTLWSQKLRRQRERRKTVSQKLKNKSNRSWKPTQALKP